MTGWNMPPGVNASDVPGNRPSDRAEEAFWDALYDKARAAGVDTDSDAFERLGVEVWAMLGVAWSLGYQEGVSDADLCTSLRES